MFQLTFDTSSEIAWHSSVVGQTLVTFFLVNQISQKEHTYPDVVVSETIRAYKGSLTIPSKDYDEGMYLVTMKGFGTLTFLAYIGGNPILNESTYTEYGYDTTDTIYEI